METSIADQIALDDALVAPADRLKIGKCNLRLSSDVISKEATLQVVYDVLKLTPFYKAFQVIADAPEIYMQEFWASAYVHNQSVRFKMNNKKHIIASLGHSGDIRKITDVNVNKLHQPWRSFVAIINKCLSGKPSYDSLRLSQAQILWGMYNKKNVNYAYLLWEDFIFQIENKNTKKGNAMYYPRTKVSRQLVHGKDPSIPMKKQGQLALWSEMETNVHYNQCHHQGMKYSVVRGFCSGINNGGNPATSESYKDTITKQKPPTAPTEKKSGKGKLKTTELESISEADLTKAEQLKIITKRSVKKHMASHAVVLVADDGHWWYTRGSDAP
ncbi:hypothetical protein Tco_1244596 [Tanacetum coccineum]